MTQNPDKSSARLKMQEADAHLQAGEIGQARAGYAEACRLDPSDARAWVALGNLDSRLGATAEAEAAYRRALDHDPQCGEACQFLGNLLAPQGRHAEAAACYRQALQIKPDSIPARVNLAATLALQGAHDEAIGLLEGLLDAEHPRLDDEQRSAVLARLKALYDARDNIKGGGHPAPGARPENADHLAEAYKREAQALLEAGDPARAQAVLTRACELAGDDAGIRRLLGRAATPLGQHESAAANYRESLRLEPDDADTLNELAAALTALERLDEAVSCYEASLKRAPGTFAHYQLGNIHMGRQRLEEAVFHYRRALALAPRRAEIYNNLGCALRHLGQYDQAEVAFREALQIAPDHPLAHEGYTNLGTVLLILNRLEDARAAFQQATALKPDSQRAVAGEANVLQRQGEFEKAYTLVQPFLQRREADTNVALVLAAMCRPLQRCREAVALMEGLLAGEGPQPDFYEGIMLHFTLGRLLDAEGDYDRAFHHYQQGNLTAGRDFDPGAHERYVDGIISTYTPQFMARAARATHGSDRPVFIVGMPRSGTSLVEQILASHPDVFGAGELEEMHKISVDMPEAADGRPYPQAAQELSVAYCDGLAQRYLDHLSGFAPPEARRVTDKMPANFLHLGLIAQLFPGARIIHCIRDPMDTCLSCYFQNFVTISYSYDLSHLGFYYRQYERIMAHWRKALDIPMMEVRYEDLVENQEDISRALVDFCGLAWDERCLRFHQTRRVVATASYDQVRQPLYNRSVERWRHYERHLEPLRRALAGDQPQL